MIKRIANQKLLKKNPKVILEKLLKLLIEKGILSQEELNQLKKNSNK